MKENRQVSTIICSRKIYSNTKKNEYIQNFLATTIFIFFKNFEVFKNIRFSLLNVKSSGYNSYFLSLITYLDHKTLFYSKRLLPQTLFEISCDLNITKTSNCLKHS